MTKSERMNRRRFLQLSGIAAGGLMIPGLFSNAFAREEKFPGKQMEALLGFVPGGGTDQSVRLLMPTWDKYLGIVKPTIITYAPGAGGLIAMQKMVRDPRQDGHVLNFVPTPYTAWLFELKKPDFPMDAIAHIGTYFIDPDVLLVKKDAKWDRIDQFIEDARKAKEPFTVAVSAPFSASHAATVVLRELTGANLKVIPFKGGSESRNAVAGGHTHACMAPYWSALHVQELTKAIGIFADRNPAPGLLWKPVPVNEVLDVKIPNLLEPYSVMCSGKVKKNHPKNFEKLVNTFKQTVESPEFKKAAEKQQLTPFLAYMSPKETDQAIVDYLDMLKKFRPAMEKDIKQQM